MNGHGPWLAGSSCAQTTSAFGYLASSAAISAAGSGYSCSTRTIAVVLFAGLLPGGQQIVVQAAGDQQHAFDGVGLQLRVLAE